MGMTAAQRAKYDADLAALTPGTSKPKEEKPANLVEDATIGNEERLRGIPAVGRVSGTIKGTRPGDPSYIIEEANRELHAAIMRRARANLRRKA